MPQAIECKFLAPTNTKGARIKAACQAGSVIIDFHSTGRCAYDAAVVALCRKLDWCNTRWVSGDTLKSRVYVMMNDGGHLIVHPLGRRMKLKAAKAYMDEVERKHEVRTHGKGEYLYTEGQIIDIDANGTVDEGELRTIVDNGM